MFLRTRVGVQRGGIMWKTFLLQLLLVMCCAYFTGSQSANNQFHHHMSSRELSRVFQVSSHDQVPNYQIVQVENVRQRGARSVPEKPLHPSQDEKEVRLSAFGKPIKLRLKRNEAFNKKLANFKVLEAESTVSGLKYHEVFPQKSDSELGVSYHDDDNMAAVMLTENDDGSLNMDGTIGNDLVIKPLVNSETDDSYIDDEMFLDEEDFRRNSTGNQSRRNDMRQKTQRKIPKVAQPGTHVVYQRKNEESQTHSDSFSDYGIMEPGIFANRSSPHRTKRQAKDTVWPEVLLIVDYDTFILHGSSSQEIKKYFVSFWNGVDLRYKLLSQPVIKVSLAGMIVAKDRDATPYLEQNRLRPPNGDAVDAAGALTDLGKYLYREDRLPTYDLAVVITKLDMCRRRFQGGRCNRGTAGFAYVGGACVVNKRLEKVNSVAIIEDSGGFSGIIVAAHEVGHLLGCVHDGSPPPSYLGGPGATRCPWEDGFIMSDLRHTERGFRWSSCSVEQFKHFLRGETATCLFNYPHENDLLPRQLPGTILTLDQQCKRDRGTTACFRDSRVCAQLFCFDSNSGYCVSYRPAAEGSPCGDGQVCKNGRCLTELENIIPDFTHVTQTFANRPPPDVFSRRSDSSPKTARGNQSVIPSRANNTGKPTIKISQVPVYRRSRQQLQQPPKPSRIGGSTSKPLKQQISSKDCIDSVENLGGSMSCSEFLEQFGERYCDHDYMKKNCCASHSAMCSKG